jgi:hypothetical protein
MWPDTEVQEQYGVRDTQIYTYFSFFGHFWPLQPMVTFSLPIFWPEIIVF